MVPESVKDLIHLGFQVPYNVPPHSRVLSLGMAEPCVQPAHSHLVGHFLFEAVLFLDGVESSISISLRLSEIRL